jgi:hypothetical protein
MPQTDSIGMGGFRLGLSGPAAVHGTRRPAQL